MVHFKYVRTLHQGKAEQCLIKHAALMLCVIDAVSFLCFHDFFINKL